MTDLWSLRGLSWRDLAKRTCRRSWDDEVFGQAARLAFYYFLSMFPVLLLLLIWLDQFAGTGSTGSNFRDTLLGAFRQVLPREASELMAKTVGQLNAGAVIGTGAVYAGLGSVWGALNGTWAMMTGLNKAYEVKEERRWWRVLSDRIWLDDFAGDHGSHCARGNPLRQPSLGDRSASALEWIANPQFSGASYRG